MSGTSIITKFSMSLSGKQSQALDSLRLKLTEVEDQLQREKEAHKRTKVIMPMTL